ncbi:hypothetical protein HS088_TW12G00716 [Tripterygium wilfordii]|uniref:Uncharacterized protein n=1 Tax=Tripterygium wilfordii TaxID=458696 RepID=A0A7J7CZM9_TRIWF|nr:hypothetical protein HS088_TW12G00716 [Tripterygium wilfordii]
MGNVGVLNDHRMICSPLMAQSVEQMVSDMHRAKAQGADLVEVRLDYINNFQPFPDLEIILKNKPLPVLIVYRPKWEGGRYEGDENTRLQALHLANEMGADYIDFELKVAYDFLKKERMSDHTGARFIVSCSMNSVPQKEDLSHLIERMKLTEADIIKIGYRPNDITEVERMFHLVSLCQVLDFLMEFMLKDVCWTEQK